MPVEPGRYGFGKNWEDYLRKHFSEERVEISKTHLLAFLDRPDLAGLSFLDIGCGSGLHSLAALRAGAARIMSFDYDADSVAATGRLREHAGSPAHWVVRQGSVLDEPMMATLEPADVVYSWGVLHHTGDMWRAMDNAAGRMKEDGVFYAALYDHDIQVNPSAEYWLDVKQKYNRADARGKRKMERWYVWRFMLGKNFLRLPVVLRRAATYKKDRGMAFWTDIRDWLGGWPMEFAKRADVKAWAERRGLDVAKMKTGEANTEYLFKSK